MKHERIKTARAYSMLEVKDLNDGERVIRGMATTPTPDRVGDIVEPFGVRYKNPLALLWQHDSRRPVGTCTFAKPTKDGIAFEAKIAKIDVPGNLKDSVDEAWQAVKAGLVRAVSIGYRILEFSIMETGGWHLLETEVYELSLVTIPAQAEATIQNVKSIDGACRAALGDKAHAVVKRAGSSHAAFGTPATLVARSETMKTKSIADQIRDWEATRVEKQTEIVTMMEAAEESGETLNAEGQDAFDALEKEVGEIDKHIARLRKVEAINLSKAQPVAGGDAAGGSAARAVVPAQVRAPEPEKGIRFARFAKCIGLASKSGGVYTPMDVAREFYGERDPVMLDVVKTAVTVVNNSNVTLIGNTAFADFVDFLRPQTVIGRIAGLRRIPFNVPLISQATAGSASWVGEGKSKPVTTLTTARTTLAPLKITALAVATMEQLRDSSPSAETIIRDDLAAAIVQGEDEAFITYPQSGSGGVKPASISNGTTPIVSGGQDVDAIRADATAAMATFAAANNTLTDCVWVMSNTTALYLASLMNALGQPEFPGMGVNGGTFMGLPAIASSAAGSVVSLVKPSDIWIGDEGGASVSVSTEASIEMLDNPTNASIGADPVETTLVSMFQTNSVAFLVEHTVNWARRRASAVKIITGVTWGQGAS